MSSHNKTGDWGARALALRGGGDCGSCMPAVGAAIIEHLTEGSGGREGE